MICGDDLPLQQLAPRRRQGGQQLRCDHAQPVADGDTARQIFLLQCVFQCCRFCNPGRGNDQALRTRLAGQLCNAGLQRHLAGAAGAAADRGDSQSQGCSVAREAAVIVVEQSPALSCGTRRDQRTDEVLFVHTGDAGDQAYGNTGNAGG